MRSTRIAWVVLVGAALAACGGGPAREAPKKAGSEAASWLYASRGVILSWVDGKISPEAADKNLESTLDMLRREASAPGIDPKLAAPLSKGRELLENARRAIKSDNKAAAIDAAAALSDVRRQLEP